MGLATFIGGIHPYEGKELSEDKPIKVLAPEKGEVMVYPLSQHIGAPAKPLVAKGDRVLRGQIIAEAGGFISANVLSSVSGTVKGIESRLVAMVRWCSLFSWKTTVKRKRLKVSERNGTIQSFLRKKSVQLSKRPESWAWARRFPNACKIDAQGRSSH